ncbi:hypothetical protein KC334_g24 [Hortaea werneckii]|nr:hypothetical protein KC334_g24 [Hortaea werneckii]
MGCLVYTHLVSGIWIPCLCQLGHRRLMKTTLCSSWHLCRRLWAIAYGNDGLPENAYYRWPAEYLRIRTNLHHSGRITERVYSAIKTHALVLAAELSIFGGGSHGLHVTELAVPRAASQRTVFSPAALDLQQSIEAYDPRLRTHVPDEGRVHRTLLAL